MVLTLYEAEDQLFINDAIKGVEPKSIAVIIGPEGGFEASEIDALRESGAKIVTLGKRILRTETAGFTCVACLQYALGDLASKEK